MALPFVVILQILVAVGAVFGVTLLIGRIEPEAVVYVASAAPILNLLSLGLVVVPQWLANKQLAGTEEYVWTLPVPRLVYLAADLTVLLLAALPGLVIGLVFASIRFGFALEVSPIVIPAFLLVSVTGAALGYTLAYLSPSPVITNLMTNVLVFGLFVFSPVLYPADRLPELVVALHQVLPVKHMADVMRASVTGIGVSGLPVAFAVIAAWCVASLLVTHRLVSKRG